VESAVVLDEDAGGGAVEEHGGRCKTAGGLDARIEVLCSWFLVCGIVEKRMGVMLMPR
jgi:hypothetical protein